MTHETIKASFWTYGFDEVMNGLIHRGESRA